MKNKKNYFGIVVIVLICFLYVIDKEKRRADCDEISEVQIEDVSAKEDTSEDSIEKTKMKEESLPEETKKEIGEYHNSYHIMFCPRLENPHLANEEYYWLGENYALELGYLMKDIEGVNEYNRLDYATPFVLVKMPENKEKECRLNRLLIMEGIERLPAGNEEEWWRNYEIQLDYRSDRYLCWRYISRASLPDEFDWKNLYFALDIENERMIEYPDSDLFMTKRIGKLYDEMKKKQEKTVEEQDAVQEEGQYELNQSLIECNGTVFPVVKVTGLKDEAKQERINQILQEPLKACIRNEGWEDYESRQKIFNSTQIYISYKSKRWLSVVYSVQVNKNPGKWADGICDLAVVIDMQTGERVLLDDLVDMGGFKNWMYIWGIIPEDDAKQEKSLLGATRTEQENLLEMEEDSEFAMEDYLMDWTVFYLYEGKLILMESQSFYDFEIPLPEIYEYLKVDPWYD